MNVLSFLFCPSHGCLEGTKQDVMCLLQPCATIGKIVIIQEPPAQHRADNIHGCKEAAVGVPARQPSAGCIALSLQQPDILAVRRLQQVRFIYNYASTISDFETAITCCSHILCIIKYAIFHLLDFISKNSSIPLTLTFFIFSWFISST